MEELRDRKLFFVQSGNLIRYLKTSRGFSMDVYGNEF